MVMIQQRCLVQSSHTSHRSGYSCDEGVPYICVNVRMYLYDIISVPIGYPFQIPSSVRMNLYLVLL